jgi:hypothetical protein
MNRIPNPTSRKARGHSIAALGACVARTAAGCGSGSDQPGAERSPAPSRPAADLGSESPAAKTEIRLRRIGASTSRPINHLGDTHTNWPLHDAVIFSGGSGVDGATSLGKVARPSRSATAFLLRRHLLTQARGDHAARPADQRRWLQSSSLASRGSDSPVGDAVLLFTGDRGAPGRHRITPPKVAKAAANATAPGWRGCVQWVAIAST